MKERYDRVSSIVATVAALGLGAAIIRNVHLGSPRAEEVFALWAALWMLGGSWSRHSRRLRHGKEQGSQRRAA